MFILILINKIKEKSFGVWTPRFIWKIFEVMEVAYFSKKIDFL